jgi:hypothetical protein
MKIDLFKLFVAIIILVALSSCAYYPEQYYPLEQPPVYTETWTEITRNEDGTTKAVYKNQSAGYVYSPPQPEEVARAVNEMDGNGKSSGEGIDSKDYLNRPSKRTPSRNYNSRSQHTQYRPGEEMLVEIINLTPFEFYALEIEREDGVIVLGRLGKNKSAYATLRMGEHIRLFTARTELKNGRRVGKQKSELIPVDSPVIRIVYEN